MKTIIVAGFDKRYFDLGQDLIRSIRVHPELDAFDIGVLDLGLTKEQRRSLDESNVYVKEAFWNLDFPARKFYDEHEPGFKGMVARPFLSVYFNEYDKIIWLDADTWVQNSASILAINESLNHYESCGVPEVDRSYEKFTVNPGAWNAEFKSYRESFPEDVAEMLRFKPQINSGVIGLRKDALHWSLWQKYLQHGLESGSKCRTVEQHAFNIALYFHNLDFARLPSTFNWLIGNATPYYCFSTNKFVTPNPPYEEISVLHLTCMTIGKAGPFYVIDKFGKKLFTTNPLRPEYRFWEQKVHNILSLRADKSVC